MQSKKKAIQKAAIANRFSNVPRNLGPGVGRSYVDSKRNKRFELLGSIVKILNSVPFSVVYLEHQLCACQRHFEMLYWGSRFLDLPRNDFQMMMMIIQWFLQRKVQVIPPSLPSLLFLRSFKEISCDQSAHSLKLFFLIIVSLFFPLRFTTLRIISSSLMSFCSSLESICFGIC